MLNLHASMVLVSQNPLLNLDIAVVHLIDTQNTDNLHAFWSVISRCARADTLQNATRLENLSWRIFSQQSLSRLAELRSRAIRIPETSSSLGIPELSCSAESPPNSDHEMGTPLDVDLNDGFHQMAILDSPKTISSVRLETIVKSVSENKDLEPLLPLPSTIIFPVKCVQPQGRSVAASQDGHRSTKVEKKSEQLLSLPNRIGIESSTSIMPIVENSRISDSSAPASTGHASTSHSTSIVRGFSRNQVSRSTRSRTQLAIPTLTTKQTCPQPKYNPLARTGKKKTTFMIGASSEGDDASSYESPQPSSLSQRLQEYDLNYQHNHSESAIEDDEEEDEADWEDDDVSHPEELFQRVESGINIKSRPSLLTNLLHEQDRANYLQNIGSHSTPAIQRLRTSPHHGHLGLMSPHEIPQMSRAMPITNMDDAISSMPVAFSPRTTRRHMLNTELTGSLRKHLLWERQQRFPAHRGLQSRSSRSEDRPAGHSQQQASPEEIGHRIDTTIYDNGLQEYFERGW